MQSRRMYAAAGAVDTGGQGHIRETLHVRLLGVVHVHIRRYFLLKSKEFEDYKNKVWRAGLSWIFRARKAWWSHLQARRHSLRAC